MKKIVALLMIMSSLILAKGDFIFHEDFVSAQAKAKAENKPMIVMIHTAGCPECAYMEEVVFNQPETNAFMKENFITITLDFKTADKDVLKNYRHIGVPHFYFTDSDGKPVSQHIGGTRGDKFLKLLEKAKAKL